MAYIHWKRNKSGHLRAQLVHSYRDAQGRPRQKIIAHLGESPALSPEQVSALQAQYPELRFDWDAPPATWASPVPETLSDDDLWRQMKELRIRKGWNLQTLVDKLAEAGLPPIGEGSFMGLRMRATPLRWTYYKLLEQSAADGQPQPSVTRELFPYLRKIYAAKTP